MRQYLVKSKAYSISDLRRIVSDFFRNACRATKRETRSKNFREFRAAKYALAVAENGRAPYRGRPSKRALYYLDRTSRRVFSGTI